MTGPKHEPDLEAERRYLSELAAQLGELLGENLIGVYTGGSWALGDYIPRRSDLDVAAVVDRAISDPIKQQVAARLRHEALPCPARKLELVVYRLETAGSAAAQRDFELNLNSGAGIELRVDLAPRPGDSHWFAIDRSILSQCGVAISGPPADQVFAAVDRAGVLPLLAESIAWHNRNSVGTEDAVLNAYRALRFAAEGRWSSKSAAAQWALAHGAVPREQALEALAAREEPLRS